MSLISQALCNEALGCSSAKLSVAGFRYQNSVSLVVNVAQF